MPYKPPDLTREEQIAKWAMENPREAEILRRKIQAGTATERDLPFTQPSIADRKREYYAENPDLDPQSTWSSVLETFGMDNPYANDSSSYDYRQKAWQESLDEGNPDMSWFLPEIPESYQLDEGGSMFWNGNPDDPRTGDEKDQAMALNFLSWPLFGLDDEYVAAFETYGQGRGNYEDNLKYARAVKERDYEYEPPFSARSIAGTTAGLLYGGPLLKGMMGAVEGGVRGTRMAMGLAAEPATRFGRAASGAANAAGSTGAFVAGTDFGEAEGDIGERLEAVGNDNDIVPMMIGGGIGGAVLGAGKSAAMKAVPAKAKGKKGKKGGILAASVEPAPMMPRGPRTPRPQPVAPFAPSVRDDINRALSGAKGRKR